jgi:hypothetical protein
LFFGKIEDVKVGLRCLAAARLGCLAPRFSHKSGQSLVEFVAGDDGLTLTKFFEHHSLGDFTRRVDASAAGYLLPSIRIQVAGHVSVNAELLEKVGEGADLDSPGRPLLAR